MCARRGPSYTDPDLLEQFTHTGNAVMAVDAHQRIILWNQAAETLLGYTAAEVLGKSCFDILLARDSAGKLTCCENCSQMAQARRQQWPCHQLFRGRTKGGADVWLHAITFCLLAPGQQFCTLVHVLWSPKETSTAPFSAHSPEIKGIEEVSLFSLSHREFAVLRCLAAGMETKTMASLLFISPTTVRNHVQSILRKLEVHSRLEAVALAHQHRWA